MQWHAWKYTSQGAVGRPLCSPRPPDAYDGIRIRYSRSPASFSILAEEVAVERPTWPDADSLIFVEPMTDLCE